jgi:hypothetical protein
MVEMIKKLICFIVALFMLNACIVDVEVELPLENSIVLNGLIVPGDTISVSLHRSGVSTDTDGFAVIGNAMVTLFENGVALGSLRYKGNGIYRAETVAKEFTAYKIVVETPEGEIVWAETTTPEIEFEASIDKINDLYGFKSGNYILELSDNPNLDNFYWVCIARTDSVYNSGTTKNLAYSLYTNSPYIDRFNMTYDPMGSDGYYYDYEMFLHFDDRSFSGETITIDFIQTGAWNLKSENVLFFNTDIHYSNYLKSKLISEKGGEYIADDMPPLNYVPSFLYTNVHNGMGILGSYTCFSKTYDYD